jgi:hypothetical protein
MTTKKWVPEMFYKSIFDYYYFFFNLRLNRLQSLIWLNGTSCVIHAKKKKKVFETNASFGIVFYKDLFF